MFAADRVEVQILVDNSVDMLLAEEPGDVMRVSRWGLIEHFDPKRIPPQAENGISFLVRAYRGDHMYVALFDCGLTGDVLLHNARSLGVDLSAIDHVVISHGHPDHYGGVHALLTALERAVPVITHVDAFLPRYALMPDGRAAGFYNHAFSRESIERAGGNCVLTREPVELGWGIHTTGQIPRDVPFEGPRPAEPHGSPGLYQIDGEGRFRLDEVWDEQALIIDVRDVGLVVLTGCGHAGVINTILQAKRVAGDKPVAAVLGGFHLGFPTTPAENIQKTAAELRQLDVKRVIPMHCSGIGAHAAFRTLLGDRYVVPSVGTVLRLGAA